MSMSETLEQAERRRLLLQESLDAQRTQLERNRMGQFATPSALAQDVLRYAASLLPRDANIRFFDPALGAGSFFSALLRVFPRDRIRRAVGFEIDPHYGDPAAELWKEHGLIVNHCDFTRAEPAPQFNLLICNPPYVRHHHLQNGEKRRLQQRTQQASGMELSGLAGLYCHFLGQSHPWMAAGGVAGWLIPSEFMDVNYGREVKRYLLQRVTLLHIHRFDPQDVQFADALVSSAVVWFWNAPPPANHHVKFTFGGTITEPRIAREVGADALAQETKWTRFPISEIRECSDAPRLSDFFHIKRGVATGANSFFILSRDDILARGLPIELFRPILPSPRYLCQDEIAALEDGAPDVERRLYLLDTKLPEEQIRQKYPALFAYLEEGKARGLPAGYICSHRVPWYSQEQRPPAPILCTYIGRGDAKSGRPFRFILNNSRATVANVYLAMYPTARLARAVETDSILMRRIWESLNAMVPAQLLNEGRVYGGGLHKLEPKELGSVDATFLADLLPTDVVPTRGRQQWLFEGEGPQGAAPPNRRAAPKTPGRS